MSQTKSLLPTFILYRDMKLLCLEAPNDTDRAYVRYVTKVSLENVTKNLTFVQFVVAVL